MNGRAWAVVARSSAGCNRVTQTGTGYRPLVPTLVCGSTGRHASSPGATRSDRLLRSTRDSAPGKGIPRPSGNQAALSSIQTSSSCCTTSGVSRLTGWCRFSGSIWRWTSVLYAVAGRHRDARGVANDDLPVDSTESCKSIMRRLLRMPELSPSRGSTLQEALCAGQSPCARWSPEGPSALRL